MTARSKYEPHPGTLPFRALAHMARLPKDEEISNPTLAGALGCTNSGELIKALQPALAAGKIFARQKGGHMRSPIFWSMASHSDGVDVDAVAKPDAPAPTARWPHAFEASPSPSPAYPPLPDGDEFPEPGMQPHQVVTKVQSGAADSSIRETVAASSAANPLQSVWRTTTFDTTRGERRVHEKPTDFGYVYVCDHGKPVDEDCEQCDDETLAGDNLADITGVNTGKRVTITQSFRDGSSMAQEGIVSELTPSLPEPEPEAEPISVTICQSFDATASATTVAQMQALVGRITNTDAMRFGIWDNGELHVVREGKTEVWSKQQFTQLIAFLDSISLDIVRVGDVA